MVELPLRFVELGFRLQVLRVRIGRDVGIAHELGELRLCLFLQRREFLLVARERQAGLVVLRLGNGQVALHQVGKAIGRQLVVGDHGLLGGNGPQRRLIVDLQRVDIERRIGKGGLCGVERILELVRLDAKEDVAGLDWLALLHIDRRHNPGDVSGNRDLGRADISVVGPRIAPARVPEVRGSQYDRRDSADHQRQAQARAGAVALLRLAVGAPDGGTA